MRKMRLPEKITELYDRAGAIVVNDGSDQTQLDTLGQLHNDIVLNYDVLIALFGRGTADVMLKTAKRGDFFLFRLFMASAFDRINNETRKRDAK